MSRALSGAIYLATGLAFGLPTAQAQAIVVFDPGNYSQNLLTAARSLQQINNQIQSLQNQAQSLLNQARNLETIGFPELRAITGALGQIDTLMGQAQGIQFRTQALQQQFRQLFPSGFDPMRTNDAHLVDASARYAAAMSAYQQTMAIQAQVVENARADAKTLDGIVARSQGATGALQAAQATNQLLALTAQQQMQIEQMMAAQFRAQALDEARRNQAQSDGQAATAKFLGSGTAYTPR
jgi:P-type conjugative transfer protein TrbJ